MPDQTFSRRPHPEAHPSEVWIGNIYGSDFGAIGWMSKRLGRKAYDSDGALLRGGNMRPVFVARIEIEAAGVSIPEAGPIDHRW